MSFRITCDVKIDDDINNIHFKAFQPNAVTWSRKVDNYSDSCTVKVPLICRLKKNGETYENIPVQLQFNEGMKIAVSAGYDSKNVDRFKGFIRRINFTNPLEIECEGYSYQLRKKINFTKTYGATTVRHILDDLVFGTEIKLSGKIPDIPLPKAVFKNSTGTDVLDWLKEKCGLTVYFIFDVLYVGLRDVASTAIVKHRLNWNVVKDDDLKFQDKREFAKVVFVLPYRHKNGTKHEIRMGPKDGEVKEFKTLIRDEAFLKRLAEDARKTFLNRGYEGAITAFLEPYAEPVMASKITDTRYPERTGSYFIEGVEGSITAHGGGRQKILIGNSLGNG